MPRAAALDRCAEPRRIARKSLEDKIRKVEGELNDVESATDRPELSGKMQDLIARLFSFSGSKDTAAVEALLASKKNCLAKLTGVIPPSKIARYMQVENKIRAQINYDLAAAIPFVQ